MTDPFHRHPSLRDKILPAEKSFFRDFSVAKIEAVLIERGLPTGWWYSDAEREAERANTLANVPAGDLWIFGYGSLMWDPAMHFQEVRRAHVPGYARRFILKDIYGARGTPEAPGLMAGLDEGAGCDGLVFRIAAEDVERETEILWRREQIAPGYAPTLVSAHLDDAAIQALTFVAVHSEELIEANISRSEQVEFLATGTGFLGSSADYIRNTVTKLTELGIEDQDMNELLAAMEDRLRKTT